MTKTDIKEIEAELFTWERNTCDVATLAALQKEPRICLKYKYAQIKAFEKYNKKLRQTFLAPLTILMFKDVIRHALRKSAWYWPLGQMFMPLLDWYVRTFRGMYLYKREYFGLMLKRSDVFKQSWWQKDIFEIIRAPSLVAKWADMTALTRGMFIMTAIMLLLAIFTFLGFNILRNQDSRGPSYTETTKGQHKAVNP